MANLSLYSAARKANLYEQRQKYWHAAKADAIALAWLKAPGLGDQVCSLATDATIHYASTWYVIDALSNGTFPTNPLRLELAKTELGMAQSEATCAHLDFSNPSLNELETELRRYVSAKNYNYEAISGYPGDPMCQPY